MTQLANTISTATPSARTTTPSFDLQIENEEDLLAVALLPSLTELTFYGNPFTTSRSGDPPLLTSFLQDKLGIKLVRKKVSKLEKPRVFIPIKVNREIKSQLPKIRKQRLPVDLALETTFWQLWTGADLDPNQRLASPAVEGSRSFFLAYDPNQPILSPLRAEERSADLSLSSLYGEAFSPGSSLEGISFESDLLLESSLERILARKASASPTWLGQSPSGLPSHLPSQGPPGLSSPSSGPCEPEGTESRPYLRTLSGERLPETQLEPLTPPNSPLEEQDGSEVIQMIEPEEVKGEEEEKEKDGTKTLSSTASGGEVTQSAPITTSLPDQKGSEPLVSSSFGEEDLDEPPSPAQSLSVDKDLPSRGSSAEDQDRQESMPTSYPSGEDLAEGQLDQQRIPVVVLTTVSSEVEYGDQEEPPQLPTSGIQDVNLLESSEEEEHPGLSSSPLVEYGQEERPTLVDLCSARRSTLVLPSRSVSGELYKLFAQIQSYALPPEPEEDASTEEEEEEVLMSSREGTTEPIFITQVKESLDSGTSHLSLGKVTLNVPEKFKGYEELLGGDPGSDFVEPKGIQQNVQALGQALRYPLIYREGKARLDCYQKPYVSTKKKVRRSKEILLGGAGVLGGTILILDPAN
uniref:Uncharacterized protein n=1 Tax=Laticauda laticaudata TaxID=8630 RepID=A0A8C5WNF7_LATLA